MILPGPRPHAADQIGPPHLHTPCNGPEPGAGKTVALHDLARHQIAQDMPVLFLPVGSTAATSLGTLRNELGLDHDLLEVLEQWSPGVTKLLIVDALDAARTDPQADLWRQLIDLVNSRLDEWHVVASVRSWDLRHSPRLRAQFPGAPIPIDELSDSELGQVGAAWPELAQLALSAPEDLKRLLRNPFNLRLAAELLLAGADVEELSTVRDRLGLLDRYWEQRVVDGQGGIARNSLLSRVCNLSVRSRTLTAPVSGVLSDDATAGEVLEQLLSRSVLSDAAIVSSAPTVGSVRFAHHVLFDYAVAVTVFAEAGDALLRSLQEDPDLVLFARPSIDMHLERLWSDDPEAFWTVAFAVTGDESLPRLAAVAATEVVARRVVAVDELAPLVAPLIAGEGSPAQERLLRYLALAVVIDREERADIAPGIWPEVVELLSTNVETTEVPLRILVDDLVRGLES